jgi:membrane-associated phospholipid phosphatase
MGERKTKESIESKQLDFKCAGGAIVPLEHSYEYLNAHTKAYVLECHHQLVGSRCSPRGCSSKLNMHTFCFLGFLGSADDSVTIFLNNFAHRSWTADYFICSVLDTTIFKGGVVLTAYWWAWFRAPENSTEPGSRNPRDILLYTLLMCVPAVLFARLMALFLPFRARPLHNPVLHLKIAYTLNPALLESWSSFPSDHAVLFFALATGLYLAWRRMGWLMYFYTTAFIALPRVYLGYHYPSDVLAGALLGIVAVSTVQFAALRRVINWPAQRLMEYSPGLFYAGLIQLSIQTALLYDPLRILAGSAHSIFLVLVRRL